MRTSYSKKHKAAISVLSGLTAALLLLTGCSKSEETVYQIPEDRKLIVYTAHKADVYEPIIKEFEERTGIFVELKAGDTLALFDELQQDAPGTFDVMFGGGVENFEECRDYLEPYKVSEIDDFDQAIKMIPVLWCIEDDWVKNSDHSISVFVKEYKSGKLHSTYPNTRYYYQSINK